MSFFTPCSGCRRHVHAEADTCPFCGASTPGAHAEAPRVVAARLPRRALAAIGASAIVLGCSSGDGTSTSTDTGTSSDAVTDTGGPAPAYGAPADTGGPGPMYGAPADTGAADGAPTDGATDASTDGAADALKDSGGPAPAYGLPPPDAG